VIQTLNFLHGYGARVLLIFAVVLGLWGAYVYFRNQKLSGGFRSTYLIMAGLTALQGLFGVGTLLAGGRPREGILHMVYGAFAVLFLPGAYRYAQVGGDHRREALVLAGASWIVSIAYLRGMFTG
jgi:heme A synthase